MDFYEKVSFGTILAYSKKLDAHIVGFDDGCNCAVKVSDPKIRKMRD